VVKPTPPEAVPVELPLRLFGLEFFELAPAAVAPVAETPVPPTYSLGPGDTLNIRFWTKTVEETAYTPVINPDGTIFLPLVGVVTIRGLTLDQARELLLREFSRYYQDVKLEVTLEKIRSVQVFVVGEAARPGGYTLSALSTAFNAIYMAGGPSPRGSMRKIELIRNAEKAGGLDLYRYLLSGDKSEDYALESGDTLFVPVVGDVVAIRGQVKRPALYELKGGERLKDLIEMAGGVQADAYFGQAQIERIKDNKEKMIVDVNLAAALESGETDQNLLLKDGDAVEVFRTLELKANYVELEGHVMRPGQYELKPGMRVSDLVNAAEGVSLEEIFWEQANLYRVLPDRTIQIIPFNLDKAMQGAQEEDLTLQPWDKIVIYTHQEAAWLDRTVTIEGSVKNSGTYKRWGGMRVRDLIFAAGGLLPETAQTAEIARAKGEHDSEVIDVDLGKVLFGSDDAANLILQDRDRVSIKAVGRFLRKAEAATISGEVKFPGVYAFENKKIKLSELVEKAGGLGEDAFPEGAVLLRRRDKLLTKEQRETAQAVQSTLQSVVERLYQLELAKAGASAQQGAQQPAPSVSTITSVPTQPTELQAAALAGTALESTAAEAGAETMPLAPAQRLPSILPSGKIAINLKEILETKGAVGDILLEDGDVVRVPKRPLTVVVSGAVANPGAIIYEPGKNVEYYVQRVGGYNWDGDSSHSVLVRANGEVVLANKAQIVGRGDIIFTPTKVVVEVPKTHSEKIRESISLATNVATVLYVIHILAKG
jgi:protein involved in polysaccharide export with SLBB domain